MYKFLYFVIIVFAIGYCIKASTKEDQFIERTEYSGYVESSWKHGFILKDKDNRYEIDHSIYAFVVHSATVGSEITIVRDTWRSGFSHDIYYKYKIESYKGKKYNDTGAIYSIKKLQ